MKAVQFSFKMIVGNKYIDALQPKQIGMKTLFSWLFQLSCLYVLKHVKQTFQNKNELHWTQTWGINMLWDDSQLPRTAASKMQKGIQGSMRIQPPPFVWKAVDITFSILPFKYDSFLH